MCADGGAVRGKASRPSKQREGGGRASRERESEREREGRRGGEVTAYPKPQTLEKNWSFENPKTYTLNLRPQYQIHPKPETGMRFRWAATRGNFFEKEF